EHELRDERLAEPDRLGQAVNREGRIRVGLREARLAGTRGGIEQLLGRVELGQQAVQHRGVGRLAHGCASSSEALAFTCDSGSSVRISKMEIIGSTRTNRNISVRNRPIVPASVAKSQNVG